MIAAAFIGPGTVTTATLAGGNLFTLLWAIAFSTVATLTLQNARLGSVAQVGLGEAIATRTSNTVFRCPQRCSSLPLSSLVTPPTRQEISQALEQDFQAGPLARLTPGP